MYQALKLNGIVIIKVEDADLSDSLCNKPTFFFLGNIEKNRCPSVNYKFPKFHTDRTNGVVKIKVVEAVLNGSYC